MRALALLLTDYAATGAAEDLTHAMLGRQAHFELARLYYLIGRAAEGDALMKKAEELVAYELPVAARVERWCCTQGFCLPKDAAPPRRSPAAVLTEIDAGLRDRSMTSEKAETITIRRQREGVYRIELAYPAGHTGGPRLEFTVDCDGIQAHSQSDSDARAGGTARK